MHPSRLHNQGFTLLELIVVMALIALTVSFAVPRISNFLYTDQLKVSARKLVGLINRSSQLARYRQTSYVLRYVEGERRFVVEREVQEGGESDVASDEGEFRLDQSVTLKDVWSWYGETRSTGELSIRFNKNGYVEPTILHLSEEGGRDISIVLSPFLGKIQVVDTYVVPDKETTFR